MTDNRRLGDLVESVQAGFWGGDDPTIGGVQVRVVRNGDAASSPDIIPGNLPLRWVSLSERERAKLSPKDTILVSSGDVGKVARLAGAPSEPVIASNFVRRVRAARGVDASWLYYVMSSDRAAAAAIRASGGTTLQNLSWSLYRDWLVPTPTLDGQRRVAEIVDCLQDEIRAVHGELAKTRGLKEGLVIDLLSRGVDGSGRLGDSRRDSFDTPLGRLPRDWSVAKLEDLLSSADTPMRSGPFGSALLKHELVDHGVPLLGIDNVHTDRFVSDYTRFVTPSKALELRRYAVRPNDVMITIMGTVGRTCLVPLDIGHALSSKHVWTMTFDADKYLPYLVSTQLNHAPWVLAQLRKDEQGGIMSAIRSETLRSVLLPVPPIEEQRRIAAVLKAVDDQLAADTALLAKLRQLERGLLDELIFGRTSLEAAS